MKISHYFQKIGTALGKSWHPKFFGALAIEFIFLTGSVGIIALGIQIIFGELQRLLTASVAWTNAAAISSTADAYTQFVFNFVLDGLALLIPLILLWIAARVGHQMVFQKWNKKSILQAVVSSLMYFILSVLFILLMFLILDESVIAVAISVGLFVVLHYGWIHAVISIRKKPIDSIVQALKIGTTKFHLCVIPYLILWAVANLLFLAASSAAIISLVFYGVLLSSIIAFSKIFLREFLDLIH